MVNKKLVRDKLTDRREFICGYGAATINVLATFPLNKIQFRQQLDGIKARTALRQLKLEGLVNLYRGLMPPLMSRSISMSLMFGMYGTYQRMIILYFPNVPMTVNKATSGILAGCTEAILCPFERVQTLLQDKYYHDHYKNTFHSFKELQSFGIREYYRGLTPILIRNGVSSAVFLLGREQVNSHFPTSTNASTKIALDFVSGALLGSAISTIFYPLNVIKTRMQSKVGGQFDSITYTFHRVFNDRKRSWRKMFRGVHINYSRSLVSWGIVNASYELLKKWLFFEDG